MTTPSTGPPYPLTKGQRRRLEVTLVMLAGEAEEMDAFVATQDPGDGDVAHVRRILKEVHREAVRLSEELGLDVAEAPVDWRRKVRGWASLWWADVLDSGPGPLRGYGAVDPGTADFLQPRIEALAAQLMEAVGRLGPGDPAD